MSDLENIETKEMVKGNTFTNLEDLLQDDFKMKKGEVTAETVSGKKITIPIKGIRADEERRVRKAATTKLQGPKGIIEDLNDLQYNASIIDLATDNERTSIKWNDKSLADKVGAPVANAIEVIPKVISLGGMAEIVNEVMNLSGIDRNKSFEEKVEEVKN